MLRRAARAGLTALLALSLVLAAASMIRIARDPALRPFADRATAAIAAAMDREMAAAATPARIAERLTALLAEEPRNWVAIDAVTDVARERGLPYDMAAVEAARDADFSIAARASTCAACAWDIAQCRLSAELLCQAPMLTGIGDVKDLAREGMHYAAGEEVDPVTVALSAVGLGATALVLASGGTSLTLKAGAAAVKTARGMRLLSPPMTAMLQRAAREGLDWSALRRTGDLRRAVRPGTLGPLTETVREVNRLEGALPTVETLALLRHIDGPDDARRIANAAEALGPRTVGRMEVLGKARFLRATARLSNIAIGLAAGLWGIAAALMGMAAHLGHTAALRLLRRLAR
ncbi:hypothetical protein [Falsirhodobacter algicola]|uniref:Uncharacterized protein n=1 Tax=Falsirhodobacter algicola TaxID=2692330 RepID=A0A8J8MQY6_9RHOB|nr:hypothetical protein [Falsirhodobacter algicola]QUS34822.1 hypothetical protein GR316_00185 [Falsirhodobacter algicola]